MDAGTDNGRRLKRTFGWIGLLCLTAIIAVKMIRFMDETAAGGLLGAVAPSLLGPAGLYFLILSGTGKLSRLSPARLAVIVTVVALGLEFAQLLPRPGILENIRYTFDWLDVTGSLVSVGLACGVTLFLGKSMTAGNETAGHDKDTP